MIRVPGTYKLHLTIANLLLFTDQLVLLNQVAYELILVQYAVLLVEHDDETVIEHVEDLRVLGDGIHHHAHGGLVVDWELQDCVEDGKIESALFGC